MKFLLAFLLALPFLAFSQAQEADLLSTWHDDSLTPTSAYNGRYNDVWGHAVNGREFAIIGSTAGIHFIDVTEPEASLEIPSCFVPGASQGAQHIHRDFKNYGNYLYIVADQGQSTLQIADMSALPDTTYIVYSSDEHLRRAHNVFIDTVTARLYAFGVSLGSSNAALRILSLDDPEQPVLLGTYPDANLPLPYVHDGYVRHDTAFLNCGSQGLWVVDFSDPANPQVLGTMTDYPQSGYNHSGWLDASGQYYFLADETHGKDLKTVDASDLADMEVVQTFNAQSAEAKSIAHNLLWKDGLLYVSYYYDGLQVFDVSDPLQPVRIAYYDTYAEPNNGSYQGAWGIYPYLPSGLVLLSDMQNGLFIFAPVENLPSSTEEAQGPFRELRAFPLPTAAQITVELNWTDPAGVCQIGLFDPSGTAVMPLLQQALVQGRQQIQIGLPSGLANGLYFLQVEGKSLPIVIQR